MTGAEVSALGGPDWQEPRKSNETKGGTGRRSIIPPSACLPVLALGAPHRPPRINDDQQALGIGAFGRGLAMLGQHIAGEPDQEIAVMRDIGDHGAGLGHSVGGPGGTAGLDGHDRPRVLRTGWACSCARIHS